MAESVARQGAAPVEAGAAAPAVAGAHAPQAGGDRPVPGLRMITGLARFSLRGELPALAAALAPGGTPLSQAACQALTAEGCVALWLGPDEQLLLVPEDQASHVSSALTGRLGGVPHSLVDISQRQIAFELTGASARTLLAAGCPLDLREEAFPVGMCTRTVFEKSQIVLWRNGPESFHVEVGRSFAPYLTGLLAQAARELGG
jgi:sarcosine oxidase, subunit gamma